MIKKLKRKFILTSMLSIAILIAVIISAINIANYFMVSRQSQRTLDMLTEERQDKTQPDLPQDIQPPLFFEKPADRDMAMSAIFFRVTTDKNGEITEVDVSRIASVTEAEATAIAEEALEKNSENGEIDRFIYKGSMQRENGRVYTFLDNSTQLYSIFSVLAASALIGSFCLVFMLLPVILLSKRAIMPFAENMQQQKQFVTNAGHEIKTPLAIILANTDAMELYNGENKWSKNIRSQTVRLNGLMQKLLTLAGMDEETKLPMAEVSVDSLLEERLADFYEPARLKGISIKTDIAEAPPKNLNRDSIAQLFDILLDNAVKYTNENGRIEVTLCQSDKKVLVKVKNTCDNLPNDPPEKMFDRFYRGDTARTQKSGGYGIGLSAARAIAEANKGRAYAEYKGSDTIEFVVAL